MAVEFPEEIQDPDLAPGTPPSERVEKSLADVWCPCGHKWVYKSPDGYVCTVLAAGHHEKAQEYGAIPCQPALPYPPDEYPKMVARREMVEEALEAEGIDPMRGML